MKRECVFLFVAAFFLSLLLLGNCESPVFKNLEENKSLEIAKNIYGNPGEKKSLYLPVKNGKNEGYPAQSIIKVIEKQSYKKTSDLGEKTNGKIKVYYLIKRKNKSGAVSVEKEENEDKIGYQTDTESSYEDIKEHSGSKESNKEKRENPAEGYENPKEKSGYNPGTTAPENPEGDKIENVVPDWLNDEDEEMLTPAASGAADVSGIESESGYEDGSYIGFSGLMDQTNLTSAGDNKGGYDSHKFTGDNAAEKERENVGKETKEVSTWGTKIFDHQDQRENFHDTFEVREKHHNVHQHMYNILLNNHHQKNIHEHTIYDKKINRHNIHTKNIIQPYIHVYNRVIQKVIPEEEHIVKEVIPVPGVENKVIHTESFKQIVPIIKHYGNDEMGVDTKNKQEQPIPLPSENKFGPTNPPKNDVTQTNSPNFLTTTPPNINFGPSTPPKNNFGPSPPPKNNFGPSTPPKNNFGPSPQPKKNFGPSAPPKNNFGPSPPPKNNFGPSPPPNKNFGPSPPPKNNYGPVNPSTNNFGAPHPPKNEFLASNPPKNNNRLPIPHNNDFGPHNPNNNNFGHSIPHNNDYEPQNPPINNFGPQNPHENNFEPQISHNNDFRTQNPHENNFEPQIPQNNNFEPQNLHTNNFGPHNLPQINNGPRFPHNNEFRHHSPPKNNHGFPNLLMKMLENYQKPGIFSHGPSPFFKSTARPNFMSYHPQLINTYKTIMPIQSASFEIQKPLISYSESLEKKKPIVKEYFGFIEGNPGFVKIDGIPEITTPGYPGFNAEHQGNSGFIAGHPGNSEYIPGKPEDLGFNAGHPGNSAGHPGFKNDITKNFGHNKPEENNYNFRRYGDVRATPSYKFLMSL